MFTLEPITQARGGGFLLGHKPVSQVVGWNGTGFTQLVVGGGGSLEENRGIVMARRWRGSSLGRHPCHVHRGMGWWKDWTLAFAP